MLVMVIEAAHQLADPARNVTGYRFRDVAFHKALIVTSSNGTETQLYLRPSSGATSGFLTWSEFRICGYKDDEWSDHCQGAIAVEYEIQKVDLNYDQEIYEAQYRYIRDYDNATSSCTKSMRSKELYDRLDSLGLTYGPTFQTLQNIYCNNEGEATATVNIHKWVSEDSTGHIRSPHIIHPAALDAILQLINPGVNKGANGPFPIMVPSQIRKLWISNNIGGVHLSETDERLLGDCTMKLYTKAKYTGFRNAAAFVLGLDGTNGKPCIIGDFQTTFVSDNVGGSSSSGFKWKRLCYNIDWKPDPDLLDDKQISAYCSIEDSAQTSSQEAMVEEKALVGHLALLNSDRWQLGESVAKGKPHLQKYTEWAARYRAAYGINNAAIPEWACLGDDKNYLHQLYRKVEMNDAEGALIVRVARNLTRILQGQIDALDLFFHDDLMNKYYTYVQQANYAFGKLCRYVDTLAHKSPNIKVLEIGAGTGSATESILHTLGHHGAGQPGAPRFAEYIFTDISPTFFEKARDRFKTFANRMVFATLDIQQDPVQQGFTTANYDLIIAVNVSSPSNPLDNSLIFAFEGSTCNFRS